MSARVLYGKSSVDACRIKIREAIATIGFSPILAVISFDTAVSAAYLRAQMRAAEMVGITIFVTKVSSTIEEKNLVTIIENLNQDAKVHGIFVHQPLPQHLDPRVILASIDPHKDVEGIHPYNSVLRYHAGLRVASCTAIAVMEILNTTGVSLTGKEAVVVGHSEIVGRPVSLLLLDQQATVAVCHRETSNAGMLETHVRRAEILVVAVGKANLIPGHWIREGSIVIDVGVSLIDGHPVGDVEFETAQERAAFITPVPGGVGPVTAVIVMKNVVTAAQIQIQQKPHE